MALNNGVLLQTETSWAAAVRDADGVVASAGGAKPVAVSANHAVNRIPVLRGPLRMLDVIALLFKVRQRLPEARLPLEGLSTVGVLGLSSLGIMALRRLPFSRARFGWLAEVGVAALSLAPAVVALRGTQLAGYHGAEHKTISRYELKEAGANPALAHKEHERCGSNMVAPMLLADAALSAGVRRLFRQPPPGAYLATGLLSLGLALEAARWAGRNPDSRAARWMMAPGHFLQHNLTTREPSGAQLEVAETALDRLLEVQGRA